MKPWRDIFSVEKWNDIVQAYKDGRLGSKSKTLGRHIQSIFQDGVKLPHEIIELTQEIKMYHRTKKTSLDNLGPRVTQLKRIEDLARGYLRRFHANHANKRRTPEGDSVFSSLEGCVYSLAMHALRKADYLDKLYDYYKGWGALTRSRTAPMRRGPSSITCRRRSPPSPACSGWCPASGWRRKTRCTAPSS
jgi:hypothetical protein